MMNSLWPDFEDQTNEQNESLQILKIQAREIKSKTKGVVNATFSKMNYKQGPTSGLAALGQTLSALSSPCYEEVLDEELANKTDINDLYKITNYKFELYNDEYRFRLFVLNYSVMFPISLEIDEGILESVHYKNGSPISSNSELEDLLKEIFSSNKVYAVVTKMLQRGKTVE